MINTIIRNDMAKIQFLNISKKYFLEKFNKYTIFFFGKQFRNKNTISKKYSSFWKTTIIEITQQVVTMRIMLNKIIN